MALHSHIPSTRKTRIRESKVLQGYLYNGKDGKGIKEKSNSQQTYFTSYTVLIYLFYIVNSYYHLLHFCHIHTLSSMSLTTVFTSPSYRLFSISSSPACLIHQRLVYISISFSILDNHSTVLFNLWDRYSFILVISILALSIPQVHGQ